MHVWLYVWIPVHEDTLPSTIEFTNNNRRIIDTKATHTPTNRTGRKHAHGIASSFRVYMGLPAGGGQEETRS